MAETVALTLTLNGTTIQGDNQQTSLGRANTIELLSLEYSVQTPDGGRREAGEFKMVSRIDRAMPLVAHGLSANQVAVAHFKFFRPDPSGNGTTEQFLTIDADTGKVTSYDLWVPNALAPSTANQPPLVQYTMAFKHVVITYTNGGITTDDTYS